jgi:hypothetical protein
MNIAKILREKNWPEVGLPSRLLGSGQPGGHPQGQCDASQGAGRTVGHARRGRIARGHHGQGSAHTEERDRLRESIPIHEDNIDQFNF